MPIRMLLIDDHALFREGISILLRRLDADLIIHEAAECQGALDCIARHGRQDLALIDLNMPGMPGMDGIAALRRVAPTMPIVAMSGDDHPTTVLRAIDQGAVGFIPKTSTSEALISALRIVLARGIYLPPSVMNPSGQPRESAQSKSRGPEALGLTPRQCDVLREILKGHSTKLICRELGLSEGTVKSHITAVLRALNVTTRTQAVLAAGRLGLSLG